MNKYQCQVCGAVSYSAASQENLKDNSCLECDGRVEMVDGDKMNADEIVSAIESLEYLIGGDCCDNQMAFVDEIELALAALREKQARESGCQYCTTGESLNGYDDVGSFAIHPNGKTRYLEVAYNDDFYNCAVYINFCPMCGKRLEVEP